MGRFAKLSYTSNPKLQEYIGCVGTLEKNARGGYAFSMRDNGLTINTTGVQFGTVLGDVDVPNCRNLGFQTQSGTMYQFDFMDYERAIDGTQMVGNRFVGFEQTYKEGDEVYTDKGQRGVVLRYNPTIDLYTVRDIVSQGISSYSPDQLKPVNLSQVLDNAKTEAAVHNAQLGSGERELNFDYGK